MLQVKAEDCDVLLKLLGRSGHVMFDLKREVMMFEIMRLTHLVMPDLAWCDNDLAVLTQRVFVVIAAPMAVIAAIFVVKFYVNDALGEHVVAPGEWNGANGKGASQFQSPLSR